MSNSNNTMGTGHKLQIRPMELKGEIIRNVPASMLKSGRISETSIAISKAVVAYIDILGFSEKKNGDDIEDCLLDFSGPLILASREYSEVRFNIFSDCAFISASEDNADDVLSALRFAFKQWVADGILVRGGIAMGKYDEINSAAQKIAPHNTICSIFSGTAVVAAVRLEGSGPGALLFTDKECAEFYSQKYGEPIFTLKDQKIIWWSDENDSLFCFAGHSILRLLKLLSSSSDKKIIESISEKLINNLKYSRAASRDDYFPWSIISVILSSPTISAELRRKTLKALGADEKDLYKLRDDMIKDWFNRSDVKLLFAIADTDSSIPSSQILSDIISYKYTA